ncbi:MAG: monovalent cation/H(+) antiporter subunit G [Thiothrix sp.]|nr:monovalent cation/H(+) antiporter subunit G [Thiothrix sp.]HPQ96230.1 monovalent cation/H(+) antiporter subunit G [Thiolinea sp.]
MTLIIDGLTAIFLALGVFLAFTGALGTLRFPDLYTRLHASSITDTLASFMILFGLMLQAGLTLISVKLLLIFLFLWYTSPASSHALIRAAYLNRLPARLIRRPNKETPPSKP